MPRIGRSIPGTYGYIVPIVILGTPSQARTSGLSQQQAVQNRLLPPYRRTQAFLRPPAVVTTVAVAFVAPPVESRTVRTRPRDTTYVLGRPATLRVFAGPTSRLTKARPRPTTHVLRPAAVVLNPGVEQELRTLRVALVRGRPGKTDYRLQPPAVVTAAVVFVAPPLRVLNIHTRPVRTVRTLRPPTTLQVFAGPRSVLTRTRPRHTVTVLRPAAVVLVPSVELKEETIRVALVRGRPGKTDYRLQAPAVVTAPAVFTGPTSRIARIRPPRTRADLFPPAVVAPRPLAPPVTSRLVQTRPRNTIYRLEAPTTLAVFSGPRSELTKTRPQPTTTALVPAQVVRNPHVEQQLRTLRKALVQTRPRLTTTLLRPPAVVTINPPVVTDLRILTVAGRRSIAKSRLFRPATLEPFSIQLREQTIRTRLVQIRPRHTTLKLRPPTVLAALRFSTGKPWLVRGRRPDTISVLRPAAVVLVPSVEQLRRTIRVELVQTRPRHTVTARPPVVRYAPEITQVRVALVRTRPRHTVTALRPPTVVRRRPEVTQIRAALVRARPRPTTRLIRPPAVLRVFAGPVVRLTRIRPRHTIARLYGPTVVTPFVAPVSAYIRTWLTRIRPPKTLAQLFPPRRLRNVPGTACLTDQLANQACLTDQLADVACLADEGVEAVACLTDQEAFTACLVDMSAATATLRDEE